MHALTEGGYIIRKQNNRTDLGDQSQEGSFLSGEGVTEVRLQDTSLEDMPVLGSGLSSLCLCVSPPAGAECPARCRCFPFSTVRLSKRGAAALSTLVSMRLWPLI